MIRNSQPLTLIQRLQRFGDKAGCSYAGPQRTARKLWRTIESHVRPEERHALVVAWDHVVTCGEGRRELDEVVKGVIRRLALQQNEATGIYRSDTGRLPKRKRRELIAQWAQLHSATATTSVLTLEQDVYLSTSRITVEKRVLEAQEDPNR